MSIKFKSNKPLSLTGCLALLVIVPVIYTGMTYFIKWVTNYFLIKFNVGFIFSFWEMAGILFLLSIIGGAISKSK